MLSILIATLALGASPDLVGSIAYGAGASAGFAPTEWARTPDPQYVRMVDKGAGLSYFFKAKQTPSMPKSARWEPWLDSDGKAYMRLEDIFGWTYYSAPDWHKWRFDKPATFASWHMNQPGTTQEKPSINFGVGKGSGRTGETRYLGNGPILPDVPNIGALQSVDDPAKRWPWEPEEEPKVCGLDQQTFIFVAGGAFILLMVMGTIGMLLLYALFRSKRKKGMFGV